MNGMNKEKLERLLELAIREDVEGAIRDCIEKKKPFTRGYQKDIIKRYFKAMADSRDRFLMKLCKDFVGNLNETDYDNFKECFSRSALSARRVYEYLDKALHDPKAKEWEDDTEYPDTAERRSLLQGIEDNGYLPKVERINYYSQLLFSKAKALLPQVLYLMNKSDLELYKTDHFKFAKEYHGPLVAKFWVYKSMITSEPLRELLYPNWAYKKKESVSKRQSELEMDIMKVLPILFVLGLISGIFFMMSISNQ